MAIGPSRFHIFRFPFPLLQPDMGADRGGRWDLQIAVHGDTWSQNLWAICAKKLMYEWLNDYSIGLTQKKSLIHITPQPSLPILWLQQLLTEQPLLLSPSQRKGIPSNWKSHNHTLSHRTTPITVRKKNSSFPLSSIWARTRSSWPAASPEEKTEVT